MYIMTGKCVILKILRRRITKERSRKEMQEFCGIKSEKYFREKILTPMLAEGKVRRTIPDKPNSSKQKYVRK